jgi:hydrogenase maturation protein HypF
MVTAGRAALAVRITGIVQGVGFRPHVYRVAVELGLDGVVGNDDGAVFVEVEGPGAAVDAFLTRVRDGAPPLASIEGVQAAAARPWGRRGFAIVDSREAPGAVGAVAPDVAVCDRCLAEMADPGDRRYRHPFVTCTDCGPRFTITRRLPYDRPSTTMAGFTMCAACRAEYEDPGDRRYHAEPIGCHDCGPTLTWEPAVGDRARRDDALAGAAAALAAGAIVAVKGVGGYHLVCAATSDATVAELRRRKGRADKPFAVMVADVAAAARLARVDADEARLLRSPARPIVLVRARAGNGLSALVAPGNPLVGVVLAYTPLHHLLLGDGSGAPLVVTSSNPSGEPICFRDDDLDERVGHLVDGVLRHDRPIHVPCDDSVVRVGAGGPVPLRRSRGYAPLAVPVPSARRQTLAVGAELKNAFCVGAGGRAWMSQHIGDMANLATMTAFEASVEQFCRFYRITPDVVAVDAHPGYLSSRWARTHHRGRVVEVAHHHAHIASVLAENGADPARPVIGMAFDGTGYGEDGTIWGGETLLATASGYRRLGHLATVPLPGGDAAIRHPWRVALAHLRAAGVAWTDDLAPVHHAGDTAAGVTAHQLATGFGTVPTSSMGRLFDAVASLLGLRHEITYEAQAAIELEHVAEGHLADAPSLAFAAPTTAAFDAGPLVAELVRLQRAGTGAGPLAAAFHAAVADVVTAQAAAGRDRTGVTTVALSGGVWQNALLLRLTATRLAAAGFEVMTNRLVPPNDGGLALGQLLVASHTAHPEED